MDSRILLSCVRVHPLARQARLHNSLLFLGHTTVRPGLKYAAAISHASGWSMHYEIL